MARISTKDPLDKFRWMVEIEGFSRSGFASCETPSYAINTQSYAEGGSHLFPKKIIDSIEYRPIALQRGVTSDMNFHRWAAAYLEFIRGAKSIPTLETWTQPTDYRKTVYIKHLDRAGRTVKTYILFNAFPIEYKPASDFSADSDDIVSMERLVLTYESFTVIGNTQSTNPLDPSDILKRLIRKF